MPFKETVKRKGKEGTGSKFTIPEQTGAGAVLSKQSKPFFRHSIDLNDVFW